MIIPIKIDKFTFDGIQTILEQVKEVRAFNPGITVAGGLVTMYQNNDVNRQGVEWLNSQHGLPVFETTIRRSAAVDRMTFTGMPIIKQSRQSNPAHDYKALVHEYLRLFVPETGTNRSRTVIFRQRKRRMLGGSRETLIVNWCFIVLSVLSESWFLCFHMVYLVSALMHYGRAKSRLPFRTQQRIVDYGGVGFNREVFGTFQIRHINGNLAIEKNSAPPDAAVMGKIIVIKTLTQI